MTLSVPDKLKQQMEKTDFINWSSVARRAFAETLNDIKTLELLKKIKEISEIPNDIKEVKDSVVKEVIDSIEKISNKLKPKTLEEFNNWCNS